MFDWEECWEWESRQYYGSEREQVCRWSNSKPSKFDIDTSAALNMSSHNDVVILHISISVMNTHANNSGILSLCNPNNHTTDVIISYTDIHYKQKFWLLQ